MKNKFKKIISVIGATFLVGSTIGFAGAMSPFVVDNTPDYAIVTGASAAASDSVGANSIDNYLKTLYSISSDLDTNVTGDFSGSEGITEEIVLGSSVTPKIRSILLDNKIPSLLDGEFSWDDGDGSDKYDFHEEIRILDDKVRIQTTLDDKELESSVVLENDRGLEYRFVFDDTLAKDKIGTTDTDTLYLDILGIEYEILNMEAGSITVSFSDEKIVKTGDTITSKGVSLNIGDIFLKSVEVNGILINEGKTRTVKGIEVYVDTIAYHSTADKQSKAVIKYGKDISQTINNGEEYIKDDETWIWNINKLGEVGGYIGVKYDIKNVGFDDDEPKENAIGIGNAYVFPDNYATVIFEGLTNTTYEDFDLSFAEKDLYTGLVKQDDYKVVVIEGEKDDSFSLMMGSTPLETDSIYLKYSPAVPGQPDKPTSIEVYFKDIDGDIDNDHEGRIQLVKGCNDIKFVVDDTEIEVDFELVNNKTDFVLNLVSNIGETISIPLGRDGNLFDRLGDEEEDAESDDIVIGNSSVGTREDDVLTHYGVVVNDPESNADNDVVSLSIPGEQVFAEVSVLGKGKETVIEEKPVEIGSMVFTDAEKTSWQSRNVILVGGSCINSATANILGGKLCGIEFTKKTGISANKAMIKSVVSPYTEGKVALIVAGFSASDTSRATAKLVNGTLDLSIGKEYII